MADVVIFHHALGLTPGVASFAGRLRAAGHTVHTPDLFEGQRFESIETGVHYASSVGFSTLIDRGVAAVDELTPGEGRTLVVVGFSLGVLPAQRLAQTDARIAAAVLCHSCVPLGEFGDDWPDEVPVQIHAMEEDPYFLDDGDMDAALDVIGTVADAELFLYPGDQHLFADESIPSYDPTSADQLLERITALL